MTKHLESCRQKKHLSEPNKDVLASTPVVVPTPSFQSQPANPTNYKQPSINEFVTVGKRIAKKQEELTDLQVGRFFYANNLPFNVVESEEFKKLLASLNPAYTPPGRTALGGTLLDKVHIEVQEQMISELEGKNTAIMQDGWSTIQNQPVIAHRISTRDKTYYLAAEEVGADKKTSEKAWNYCRKQK
jgi:hypothetical protein